MSVSYTHLDVYKRQAMKLNIKNDGFMEYTLEDKTLDIYVEKGTHASLYVSYNGKNNVISSNIALEQDASLTLMMKNDGDEDCLLYTSRCV